MGQLLFLKVSLFQKDLKISYITAILNYYYYMHKILNIICNYQKIFIFWNILSLKNIWKHYKVKLLKNSYTGELAFSKFQFLQTVWTHHIIQLSLNFKMDTSTLTLLYFIIQNYLKICNRTFLYKSLYVETHSPLKICYSNVFEYIIYRNF